MAARKASPSFHTSNPLGCADAVDSLARLARSTDADLDQLPAALHSLAQQLDQAQYAALALVTQTAAENCLKVSTNQSVIRGAIDELCERLLVALSTEQPFDCSQTSASLEAMLFPDEAAAQPSAFTPSSRHSVPTLPIADQNSKPQRGSGSKTKSRRQVDAAKRDRQPVASNDSLSAAPSAASCGTSVADAASAVVCTIDPISGQSHCTNLDPVILQEFLTECIEHQSHAEQFMLALEANPHDQEALHGLFRSVHSLKGVSGVCDMESLGRLAHLAESALVRVRQGELVLEAGLFNVLLLAIDFMGRQLRSLQAVPQHGQNLHYPSPPIELLEALSTAVETGRCAPQSLDTVQIALEHGQRNLTNSQSERGSQKSNSESLRVDSKRLGLLIDLIGELVITETMIQRELDSRQTLSAMSVGTRLRKVVREVQQLSLTLKMVPVGTLFQKLNRMVRDLGNKLHKPTTLLIEGADTEVDKSLLECLADPLMHLVRNSLDHGIETATERRAAGKPSVATIRVTAEHRAGNVHFTISDDGRGLDRKKILDRARSLGMVDQHASLTNREIDRLIFNPGFSTVERATELSGRGVGLDVVRKNIESMRGSIHIESMLGFGTTVRLELPLTLSIVDGTVIRVGMRRFIVPTLSVTEQVQLNEVRLMPTSGGDLMEYRGTYLPLVRLGDVVHVEHDESPERGQVCLVVESSTKRYGLIVDGILGQQPVVIKSLGEILDDFTIYSGGAILSDGGIAFVLDPAGLIRGRIQKVNHESTVMAT